MSVTRHRRFASMVGLLLLAPPAGAVDTIYNFGTGDAISLDQPRVVVGITEPGSSTLLGPGIFGNAFILDTGANGILLAQAAHFPTDYDFLSGDDLYPKSLYQNALRDGVEVQYDEIGVDGVSAFDVLKAYDLSYAGFEMSDLLDPQAGATAAYGLPAIHMLRRHDLQLGGFGGIVGMPAMQGRVTQIDLRPMTPLGLIAVDFSEPVATSNSYQIQLGRLKAHPEAGQRHPNDPLPLFADLPLVGGVQTGMTGKTATFGTFLLDTGAQLTMITSSTLAAMGVNLQEEGVIQDYIEVGGVGGTTVNVPLVTIDRLTLTATSVLDPTKTAQFQFDNLTVGVLDIDGLPVDGILGMNVLTTGYFQGLLAALSSGGDLLDLFDSAEPGEDGAFERIVLDFDQDQWAMRFDVNENFVPQDLSQYGSFFADGSELNDDISAAVNLLAAQTGDAAPTWAWPLFNQVPEPTSILLLTAPALWLLRRRSA